MNWHSYITSASNDMSEEVNIILDKMINLREIYEPIFDLYMGDLINKNCAKTIIKEDTKPYFIKNGYPRYSFRFQCLLTGRQSRLIKMADYLKFGITKSASNNGDFFSYKMDIEDKIKPICDDFNKKFFLLREQLVKVYSNPENTRKYRYYEYLNSNDWYDKRTQILNRDKCCVISKSTENLHVHHLTYDNVGKENLNELVLVSKNVHKILHDKNHNLYELYNNKVLTYINNL